MLSTRQRTWQQLTHGMSAGLDILQQWPQYSTALAAVIAELDTLTQQQAQQAAHELQRQLSISSQGASPPQLPQGLLPPSFIPLPLSTSFLIIMVFASLVNAPTTARSGAVGAVHGASGHSPHLHLPSAVTRHLELLHSHRSRAADKSPYLRLLRSYLSGLLPQDPSGGAPPVHPGHSTARLGVRFLGVMLEMWLTDLDMPAPAAQATSRRGSAASTPRGVDASCPYSAPSTLHVKCLHVRDANAIATCRLARHLVGAID
jgi:hypothetical protein